ncbi:GntR family transcriptional regulator [Dichotomicrobium thermohalophilum]|uniref:GntR family transcriptional regulator n=1 Tax=Dichotomicrobium thermohalophilum TaxID=933063 RepID=A0A397Q0Y2_9HYPH|nr:GntR family transcriptional regulator [Dichotomicrobium thermohalophilum]RIA55170.1 GntR family transcriptional regulator [Dichotomicrobium thermohalophilum]
MEKLDAQPLYTRVKRALAERILSGIWAPGRLLPNEFQLAEEFGVSQGTVRKALDALAAEHLVERHQGRGTFVARHTSDTVHFRFFQLYDAGGRIQPDSRDVRVAVADPSGRERAALALAPEGRVIRITRTRTHEDHPIIDEQISLSEALFSGLLERETIPNTLYDLYQTDFGITVARVEENLRAAPASEATARRLDCPVGTPVLAIERVAFDYSGQPVEWRVSQCLTDSVFYHSTLK